VLITITIVALVLVAILCALGALHPAYDDSLAQRAGMACICLSSVALLHHVWSARQVLPACSLMSIGMLLFAVGVALKVVKFSRPPWHDTLIDLQSAQKDFEVHP
jgi:hypothetical protein